MFKSWLKSFREPLRPQAWNFIMDTIHNFFRFFHFFIDLNMALCQTFTFWKQNRQKTKHIAKHWAQLLQMCHKRFIKHAQSMLSYDVCSDGQVEKCVKTSQWQKRCQNKEANEPECVRTEEIKVRDFIIICYGLQRWHKTSIETCPRPTIFFAILSETLRPEYVKKRKMNIVNQNCHIVIQNCLI